MILKLTALLALAATQGGAPPTRQAPAPKEADALVSKVFSRHHGAQSMAGTIRLNQSAKGVTLSISTGFQFSRPSMIYIHQERGGSNPRQVTVVSDGKFFSYDKPEGRLGKNRYTEYVTQGGYTQTVRDMYAAAGQSIVDRSPVLDIAMGRREDLADLKAHWSALRITGRTTLRNTEVVVIEGNFHDMPGSDPTGTFQMMVTEEGDLLRYGHTQRFRMPEKTNETIEVISIWDADIKVDAKTDAGRYRVG